MIFAKNNDKKTAEENNEKPSMSKDEVFDKPLIALFDTKRDVKKKLADHKFSCTEATLGSPVKIIHKKEDSRYGFDLKLNYSYPENLHEFDIVIFDMTKTSYVDYSASEIGNIKGKDAYAFFCGYPQTIFDPRPLAALEVSNEIMQILKKCSAVIAFCGEEQTEDYVSINISTRHADNSFNTSIFAFYKQFPKSQNKTGKKLNTPKNETKLSTLLIKYLSNSVYKTIFEHPLKRTDKGVQPTTNFIPLLVNNDDEIVSFCHSIGEGFVFVFPDINDKASFLLELFNVYLPEIIPKLFPYHGQFCWLENGDYLLPKEFELCQRKIKLTERYEKELQEIDKNIEDNKIEYHFLHELLYQTGDELAKAVELFLKWVGFESIKNMDETNPEIREEDLQIETEKGLLVIEVKGIGGTSTDKDCSQIHKIILRRAKQRKAFDVSGLYIVNHQRYMPPKARNNPPFTDHQIMDAQHDERGLLTTYSLYKAYFLIEAGILTKEEVREQLFDTGLITLEPKNLLFIGVPNEILKEGKVAILNLDGQVSIAKKCKLIVKKNNEYEAVFVHSLQLKGQEVEEVSSGEVGLMLSAPIKKGTELYISHSQALLGNAYP